MVISEYINRIKNINDEILTNVPEDWNVSYKEKEALKEFLLDRLHRIEEICTLLKVEGGD